jgi:hypothetical protein
MGRSRSDVVSSFTIIKGAMISETYTTLAAWNVALSKKDNLDRLRRDNPIGAKSQAWLRDVAWVLSRRLDPSGRDRALTLLAQSGCDLEVWKPLLLWHITRDEFLLRDFLIHWLYPAHAAGAYRIKPEELHDYLRGISTRGGTTEHAWSPTTLGRVAAGLLKIATDFGLLKGGARKEFAFFHLPESSFLYLLHVMRDAMQHPRRAIEAADWRMFLMAPADVERELLRLHQFRKLSYEVAGSLVQLTLPCGSATEYAERMAA